MEFPKNYLIKLLALVNEIRLTPGNEWFDEELHQFNKKSPESGSKEIKEIHEYCIQLIIKSHAENFYKDFKLKDIKNRLIDDFIRMEHFRRNDNFEDFCLAAYQQLEAIVNRLCPSPLFQDYIIKNIHTPAIEKFDNETKTFVKSGAISIGNLLFQTSDKENINFYIKDPIEKWFFKYRMKAILYYYYFGCSLKSKASFEKIFEVGDKLYQGRNLNHRDMNKTEYQQIIINTLIPNQHRYYFKFLGFLEDFTFIVNSNLNPNNTLI